MDGYHIADPQEQVNDTDPATGKVVAGMRVTAHDHETGTRVQVFLPNHVYSAANVRDAVEHKIAQVREVAALGTPPPPAQ